MPPKIFFPKVKEAREYLLEKAKTLMELQEKLILEAAAAGEYDAALKANQWLIEHTPADEKGERSIGVSASKPKEIEAGKSGVVVQIGIGFGGIKPDNPTPEVNILTGETIEIKDTNS